MNFRQVHLDFHTSEKIPGVGSKFDKKQFQNALKTGHVNSITIFSKCHHGYAFHPTKANEMHPSLSFDLLGAEIEAAHEIGVKTPVYISAGLDEKMARRHPDWLVRNRDETTTWVPDFSVAGYHKFCMASPYLEYLCGQIEEVVSTYDADGIFLDIVGVQPCYCQNCIRERLAKGVDPYDPDEVVRHAEEVYARYARATRAAVDKHKPGLPLFQNSGHIRQGRRDLAHFNTHLEVESLPTGEWGYDHFPMAARYSQGLGMEVVGMTGKFHTMWGEFGGYKHPNALRYEAALSVANGAKCSIGDQLSPDGEFDMVTYGIIGEAYKEVEEKEPWLDGVTSVADIAVLSLETYFGSFGSGQSAKVNVNDCGVVRMLLEGNYLFDYIDYESDLSKYKLLILPDEVRLCGKLLDTVKAFCQKGGKVLASGKSAMNESGDSFVLDLGAKYIGEGEYNPCYTRPVSNVKGMGDTGYVIYGASHIVECTGKEHARVEKPYFNRAWDHFCSHRHTPNSGEYYGAGITEGKDGIYIAWNIFEDYSVNGSIYSKQLVLFALDTLLGEGKTLTTSLPAQGIVTLMKQGGRLVNHLLYASPVRRGECTEIIEDIIPLYNIDVRILMDREPKRVYLAPALEDIPFEYKDGALSYTVPKLECHQMTVIEF